MAKVYVSSTVADLTAERKAVIDWLVAAGHQPVHSYKPNSETVRDSCLDDVDGCELYVLILGHRYGFQPEDANPEKLSITQLEFRRANGKPRVALLRTSIPNIALSDVANPERLKLVQSFREEVQRAVRPAEFSDPQGLIQALSTGVQSELDKLQRRPTTGGAQISPNDPAVLAIISTLTRQIDSKDAENAALRGRVQELEDQLSSAIARTLTVAAQPDASPAAVAAADALESGDSGPAEALLRSQEREEVAQIGRPNADDAQQRRQAAQLARDQGALAISHDLRTALEAYQRAAEYEPDDYWTHFLIGDLQLRLGSSEAATRSYRRGAAASERRVTANQNDLDGQRGLSVSHNKIGDVLMTKGDGEEALVEYREALAIGEALAARDPANTRWQRGSRGELR
jgi:tetratricopeptide (TPR) repeat protein